MLLSYGNYTLSFAISSTGGGAAFLTPSSYLNDAKNGVICSMRWDTGVQTTATRVDITVTITKAMDTTPAIGAVGFVNVQLPAGTLVKYGGSGGGAQRLVPGIRGELSSWWIPYVTGGSFVLSIYNDVNGSPSIAAGSTWGAGEIYVGRVTQLPTLVASGTNPTSASQDLTGWNQANLGQLYPIMRVPQRLKRGTLGYGPTSNIAGGSTYSGVQAGSNPASKIDLNTLRDLFSTQQLLAVCDLPSAGFGAGTLTNGMRYDQAFMQPNWMIARMKSAGDLVMDQYPYWSWNPEFMEAR